LTNGIPSILRHAQDLDADRECALLVGVRDAARPNARLHPANHQLGVAMTPMRRYGVLVGNVGAFAKGIFRAVALSLFGGLAECGTTPARHELTAA